MLSINDVEVDCGPVLYTCYGLGSCVGLFISDRLQQLSGGAHISLPSSCGSGVYPDATCMINALMAGLREKGSDLNSLRAKIVGGAKVYDFPGNIGEQNINVVLQYMLLNRIFVAATDLGGNIARTARFNSITGAVGISTSDQKKYFI